MNITKALRKLSPEDREEANALIADLRDNDGMEQKEATEYALRMLKDEAEIQRNGMIERMKRGR